MNLFENFFTWKGRLNRRPSFFRGLLLVGVTKLLVEVPEAYKIEVSPTLKMAMIVVVVFITVVIYMQVIKRCHDIDLSGWFSLFSLIPFVNLFFGLYMTFKKGTDGTNRFGPDPLSRVAS